MALNWKEFFSYFLGAYVKFLDPSPEVYRVSSCEPFCQVFQKKRPHEQYFSYLYLFKRHYLFTCEYFHQVASWKRGTIIVQLFSRIVVYFCHVLHPYLTDRRLSYLLLVFEFLKSDNRRRWFFFFFFAPDKRVPLEFELRAGKEHLAQSSCRSLVHWHAIFPSVSTRACNSHAIKKKTESERNEAVLLIPQRRRQSKTKDGGDGP